jgi:transcriptional regulator with XRE-family HTH domain
MTIGNNIKKYREKKGLTQEQLAVIVREKTGRKSKNFISNWENGLNDPDADAILVLADAFGIDVNTLMGWDDKGKMKADADNEAHKLIDKLNSLSEKDRAFILEMIDRMTRK